MSHAGNACDRRCMALSPPAKPSRHVPAFPSSLLHRSRRGLLVLLLVVLPLHSVAQLVAGLQAHRHVHTGAFHAPAAQGSALAALAQPLRSVLDRLHAAQDPLLMGPSLGWVVSRGPAAGLHHHGGVYHRHSQDTHDAIDVGEATDNAVQGGVTAFLAWLPLGLLLPAGEGVDRPVASECDVWRDRVVAPPLTPPRG